MPFAGLAGSDLTKVSGFATMRDPYGGGEVVVIPPIKPDVALIHVQEADEEGNLRILGSPYEDVLLAKASARIVATAERIVPRQRFVEQPELTALPGFLVDTVVEAPRGAWPTSCAGDYGYDKDFLTSYVAAAKTEEGFDAFLRDHICSSPTGPTRTASGEAR
jgi:glutaconate CoA-transferase subunit A